MTKPDVASVATGMAKAILRAFIEVFHGATDCTELEPHKDIVLKKGYAAGPLVVRAPNRGTTL